MSNENSFFGGQNILDGMPLRRAGTILFAIEGRTAQLVAQSQQALASYLTEKTAAEKEQAFLAAIVQGRDFHLQPAIQDIERYAPEWRSLVPLDVNQRAGLVKKIADKYRFRYQDVPELRKDLGLDTDEVKQAYERLFHTPIGTIYASKVAFLEKISWISSRLANRLERLPPFWTAFSLTLTETVGGSILALPIAFAGVGPISGVILLFILGLVNVLTVMGIVEAITRNGNMRYGTAYFGRLVGDYLGKPGSIILIPALMLLNVISLVAYYIGISVSLADITNITPLLWAALLFLIGAYFLRRESLSATVASALVIGIVNITIIIILSLLTFPHVQSGNFQNINTLFGKGHLFEPKILELIFGVVLFAYFGHTSAGNAAKVVLRRDPGGSSLIWGNVAAMLAAIALYSLWIVAVNGAIPVRDLSSETGTALSPLAIKIGGSVPILGIIYIILAMGIGTVHYSYALYNQIREVLPSKTKKTAQFLVSLAPIFFLFLIVEWMLFTNRESYSQLLGIVGVLLLPLLGGIFPMLMLAASRRKGDYVPKLSLGLLGNPVVQTSVYLIYMGSIFAYGIFIWDDPIERFMAIGMGILLLFLTFLVIRQGALASRVVIEFRVEITDMGERASVAIIDKGKTFAGNFRFLYASGEKYLKGAQADITDFKQLKSIDIDFPATSSKEVKVWLHRITPEGNSKPIPAVLFIKDGCDTAVQFGANKSSAIVPLTSRVCGFKISFL